MRTVRFPEDFDRAVLRLMETQNKRRYQLIRGSLIMAWQDYFLAELGAERLDALVAEYTRPEPKSDDVEDSDETTSAQQGGKDEHDTDKAD